MDWYDHLFAMWAFFGGGFAFYLILIGSDWLYVWMSASGLIVILPVVFWMIWGKKTKKIESCKHCLKVVRI